MTIRYLKNFKKRLTRVLYKELRKRKDDFIPGMEYVKKWNYLVDETVPYRKVNHEGKPVLEEQ